MRSKSLLFKPFFCPRPTQGPPNCPPGTLTRLEEVGSPHKMQDTHLNVNFRYTENNFLVQVYPRRYLGYTYTKEVASVYLKFTSNWFGSPVFSLVKLRDPTWGDHREKWGPRAKPGGVRASSSLSPSLGVPTCYMGEMLASTYRQAHCAGHYFKEQKTSD